MDVDPQTLSSVSGSLRDAADDMADGLTQPPVTVEAGPLTALFLGVATKCVEESETLAGQLGGAAEAVASSRETYTQVDEATRHAFRPWEEQEQEFKRQCPELAERGIHHDEVY